MNGITTQSPGEGKVFRNGKKIFLSPFINNFFPLEFHRSSSGIEERKGDSNARDQGTCGFRNLLSR